MIISVFRALGIPTRCVTSFKAAHDSDFSSAMDAHWTLDGKPRKTLDDAVWYVNTLESANIMCGSRGGGSEPPPPPPEKLP